MIWPYERFSNQMTTSGAAVAALDDCSAGADVTADDDTAGIDAAVFGVASPADGVRAQAPAMRSSASETVSRPTHRRYRSSRSAPFRGIDESSQHLGQLPPNRV